MRAIPLSRYLIFTVIAAAGCAADLLTKHAVFAWLGMPGQSPPWWIIPGWLGFETSTNTGALFGLGQDRVMLFVAISALALGAILYWLFVRGAARQLLLTVTLALVTAGILGNLHDRLGLWSVPGMPDQRRAEVRDWILFRVRHWTWPNFNLADSLLVCGALLLVLQSFKQERPAATTDAERQAPAP